MTKELKALEYFHRNFYYNDEDYDSYTCDKHFSIITNAINTLNFLKTNITFTIKKNTYSTSDKDYYCFTFGDNSVDVSKELGDILIEVLELHEQK